MLRRKGDSRLNTTPLTGLRVLGLALPLGLWGDLLIRGGPPGVNFLLWTLPLVAAIFYLARSGQVSTAGDGRWLLPIALATSAGVAWRDSDALTLFNLLATAVTLALGTSVLQTESLREAGLSRYLRWLIEMAGRAVTGLAPVLVAGVRWQEIPRGRWYATAAQVIRALLIALPLLLLFGLLFMSADAVFASFVERTLQVNLENLFGHLVATGIIAWLTAALLRTAVRPPAPASQGHPATQPTPLQPESRPLSVTPLESGLILGLLNALFLAFVLVQIRYLFGGAALVETTIDLSYAEYARRGFFELVAVTALVLPVLLIGDWLTPETGRRLFRTLSFSLIVLVAVIMASALRRMLIYMGEFGLTELRLYVTVAMAWIAILLVWFTLTVLRGRPERFAFGGLVSALALLAVLHLANPDGLIVRTNLARLQSGSRFDVHYVTRLNGDGVPALIAGLDQMGAEDRRIAAQSLLARWGPESNRSQTDWRSWNLGRLRARQAVAENLEPLLAAAGPEGR